MDGWRANVRRAGDGLVLAASHHCCNVSLDGQQTCLSGEMKVTMVTHKPRILELQHTCLHSVPVPLCYVAGGGAAPLLLTDDNLCMVPWHPCRAASDCPPWVFQKMASGSKSCSRGLVGFPGRANTACKYTLALLWAACSIMDRLG